MQIHSALKWILGSVVLVSLLSVPAVSAPASSSQATTSQQTTIPRDDAKDFQARLGKYLDIQKKALRTVPSISKKEVEDPAVIVRHEREVAEAIRALRPDAMPGDIFTPWLRSVIATAVKQQVQGPRGRDAKATIVGEGNPAESSDPVPLKVNGGYPQKAPLSTVPPSVLLALPPLPKEVEYRFVGHTLILRDTKANIIVDILPNAF